MLLALVGLVFANSGVASADEAGVQAVEFQIRAKHSDQCLDVSDVSSANSAPVVQFTCYSPAHINQLWHIVDNSDGTYLVKAFHSGKCLDVSNGDTGESIPVVQFTCDSAKKHQRWDFVFVGGNFYELRPVHAPTKCLDVADASTTPSTRVVTFTCHGTDNQRWRLVSA